MRVLITGAGGTLGLALAPALAQAGHEPVLQDVRNIESEYDFVQGDVRSAEDVLAAARDVDVVVHAAAIHGIHLGSHSTREFYDLNLTGTLNVWEAAVEVGARAVVFSSSMGVYKTHSAPGGGSALREDVPLRPGDVYGWTKLAGEELCQLYGRTHGIPSVGLRFGMFVPEPFFRYGIRLLYGGVDTSDVVRSVLTSIDALTTGRLTWASCNVESAVPFQDDDVEQLARDPLPVLDEYYPGASGCCASGAWDRSLRSPSPTRWSTPGRSSASSRSATSSSGWTSSAAAPTSGPTPVRRGRERHLQHERSTRRSRRWRSRRPCCRGTPAVAARSDRDHHVRRPVAHVVASARCPPQLSRTTSS